MNRRPERRVRQSAADAAWAAIALSAAVSLMAIPQVIAQLGARPAFEVASVKVSTPRFPGRSFLPGGRFRATNLPLKALIQVAYDIPPILIFGGPKWVDSEG